MSAAETVATFLHAGINNISGQRLRSCLSVLLSYQLFASRDECFELRKSIRISVPTCGTIQSEEDGTIINFSQVPVMEEIVQNVNDYLQREKSEGEEIKSMDILISGDHGQGAFVNRVKILLKDAADSF